MGWWWQSSTHLSAVLVTIIVMTLGTYAIPNSPPRIIKQPPPDELLFKVAQQTKESDKPFIIECEADGNPPPTYDWVKNGKPFEYQVYDNRISQQPARGSLVISAPRDEDMGQYQCFARNEFGIATSNSVFVRKAELNSFKDDILKVERANEGAPFYLKCEPPDGWPKPIVNWLIVKDNGIQTINNSRMTLDPEGTLWFSNVTQVDQSTDFAYACSATSVFRNEYKIGNRVKLIIDPLGGSASQNKKEPVEQYVSRKNTVAMRGKTAELFCIYGGTPLPQTVWKKNSRPIDWGDRITQGHYGKSLLIRHVSFNDNGTYTCDVSNGVGTARSYSMHLTVQSVPYFTQEPEIINAAEEEDAEFVCRAEGVPQPTIRWIHNGKPISQAPPNPRRFVETNRIFIKNLLKNDTGNYGCNATNEHGYVYKDVYLNVLSLAPEILEAPQNVRTVTGKNVEMVCKVFGAPKPRVKWLFNQKTLSGGRYETVNNGSLIIRNVAFQDSGHYTCIAENKLGKIEANGTLDVKKHTQITEPPSDYEVVAGQTATFRCNAVADSSLDLEIDWLKDGVAIDFEREARFVKTNDNSLVIAQTIELDTSLYTCKARTDLDVASAAATLIVQDVPNAPILKKVHCDKLLATISWDPSGDKRSPILYFIIQYNTSFTPDIWEQASVNVPSTDFTYSVQMSPWANYTYRVIAFNKIGPSLPSKRSDEVCTTDPAVPDKNPDNVEGKGTEPNNMVISWTPMPKIEHNGERFIYRVFWKRDEPHSQWETRDIDRWEQSNLMVNDTPTFVPYVIKVVAINAIGEANVAAKEVIGYSGEAQPLEAPTNLTLDQIVSSTSAILNWNPVDPASVRGHFKGYKIQTWTQEEGEENYREIYVKGDSNKALVTKFKPYAKNFARVLVYNGRYNGPSSATIDFDAPEGVPSPVQTLDAYPLGPSAFLVQWKKPLHPNGKLNGYRIYYQKVVGTSISENRMEKVIRDPNVTQTKLSALESNTKYRLFVTATTKQGEGEEHFIERRTGSTLIVKPDVPNFDIHQIPTNNGKVSVRVTWKPNFDSNKAGSHFKVDYRKKGTTQFESREEINEDFIDIGGLDADSQYEFRVQSINGEEITSSPIRVYDTSDIEGPIKVPNENVANAGWFIGMMLALAIIILLFIIVCIIRRNRGGKYDVHDREMANGRRDYPDEGGFHEYSQPLDTKSAGRQSVSSNQLKPESDTDSMAEYGDGDTGQFTEDGSFIGQYVPGKLQPPVSPQPTHNQQQPPLSQGTNNAVATYV